MMRAYQNFLFVDGLSWKTFQQQHPLCNISCSGLRFPQDKLNGNEVKQSFHNETHTMYFIHRQQLSRAYLPTDTMNF